MGKIKLCRLPLSFLENLKGKDCPRQYCEIQGQKVKLVSKRFPAFKQSQSCYICGKSATYLSVEKQKKEYEHFNIEMFGENGLLFTIDHVIPLSKGGTNDISNLKTCCKYCNQKKGNKLISFN